MNRRSSFDLQTLVDSHELPYLVIDRERRIVAANQAFLRHAGCRAEEAIGASCFCLTHGRNRPCHLDGEICPHEQVFRFGIRSNGLRDYRDPAGRGVRIRQIGVPLTATDGELLLGKSLVREATPELEEPLSRIEQRQIQRLLDSCDGNRRRVAERLGISERTLYRRLKRYGTG